MVTFRPADLIGGVGVAVLMLGLQGPGSATAQSPAGDTLAEAKAAAAEIDKAAEAAAEVAYAAASNPDEHAEQRRADALTIANAMTQLAAAPNSPLANKLLLPQSAGFSEITTALSYPAAWQAAAQHNLSNTAYRDAVASYVFRAAWLYFAEWSCHTGNEVAIAHQMIDLLPRLVTTYPERLLLRSFVRDRDALGYPNARRCRSDHLPIERGKYQHDLSAVLAGL